MSYLIDSLYQTVHHVLVCIAGIIGTVYIYMYTCVAGVIGTVYTCVAGVIGTVYTCVAGVIAAVYTCIVAQLFLYRCIGVSIT